MRCCYCKFEGGGMVWYGYITNRAGDITIEFIKNGVCAGEILKGSVGKDGAITANGDGSTALFLNQHGWYRRGQESYAVKYDVLGVDE